MTIKIQKNSILLAPMAGVTDVAFRHLAKKYGAYLTFTEFINAIAINRENKKTEKLAIPEEIGLTAVQIFGSSIEDIKNAAIKMYEYFDLIDINVGCPVHKVIRTGSGSELLKKPEKIGAIVRAIVKEGIPVSVKMRIGINDDKDALYIAKVIEEAGAEFITVHGRTQKQGYMGTADWKVIKDIKQELFIPVVGNGDIDSPETAEQKIEYSRVDGIMIGRAAMKNIYVIKQISDYLSKHKYTSKRWTDIFFEYLELAEYYSIPFIYIKNHAIQMTKGIEGGRRMRTEIMKIRELSQLKDMVAKLNKKE